MVLLLCICAFLLHGCTEGKPEESVPPQIGDGDESVDSLACFVPADGIDAEPLNAAILSAASNAGIHAESFAAESVSEQVKQISDVMGKVDAMIVYPVSTAGIETAISSAAALGTQVLTLHMNILSPEKTVSFVGPDYTGAGTQAAIQIMSDFPSGGALAFVYGPETDAAQQAIADGYNDAVEKSLSPISSQKGPDWELAFSINCDWSAEDAYAQCSEQFSEQARIDAIFCSSDSMIPGVLEAARTAGLLKGDDDRAAGIPPFYLYGLGGQTNVLQGIADGVIRATLVADLDQEAATAVSLVEKLIKGEAVERINWIPFNLVTAENVANYLYRPSN